MAFSIQQEYKAFITNFYLIEGYVSRRLVTEFLENRSRRR